MKNLKCLVLSTFLVYMCTIKVQAQPEASTGSEAASSSAPAAGSGKKKRGRRKNKKKEGETTAGESMFEENDGWEDVEMAE